MRTKHGSSCINAVHPAAVERSPLRLVSSKIPVHPSLAKYVAWNPEDVTLAAERISLGGIPHPVETLGGKIVNMVGAIEAEALASLGRKIVTVEVPKPDNLVEYILRSIPVHRTELDRACAVVLAKDDYLKIGKARMSEGGRRGALIRHGKGSAETSEPQDPVPVWFERAARILQIRPYTIKTLDRVRREAPDMFEAIREHRITHLSDALALATRFKGTPEDRLACLDFAKSRGWPHAGVRLTECFSFFARGTRPTLKGKSVNGRGVVTGKGYTLYLGKMEDRGKLVAPESVDVMFADIVYNRPEMAREVAKLALRVLAPGGFLIIVNGNLANYTMLKTVMDVAGVRAHGGSRRKGEGLHDVCQLYVHYANDTTSKRWIKRVDGCPYFVFSKGPPSTITHLHFISESSPRLHHLWQKNVKVMGEILAAVAPTRKGERPPRVLDPCMGWGTTGVAALRLGYEFVGIEREADRFRIASADVAKATKVDKSAGRKIKAARRGVRRAGSPRRPNDRKVQS